MLTLGTNKDSLLKKLKKRPELWSCQERWGRRQHRDIMDVNCHDITSLQTQLLTKFNKVMKKKIFNGIVLILYSHHHQTGRFFLYVKLNFVWLRKMLKRIVSYNIVSLVRGLSWGHVTHTCCPNVILKPLTFLRGLQVLLHHCSTETQFSYRVSFSWQTRVSVEWHQPFGHRSHCQ